MKRPAAGTAARSLLPRGLSFGTTLSRCSPCPIAGETKKGSASERDEDEPPGRREGGRSPRRRRRTESENSRGRRPGGAERKNKGRIKTKVRAYICVPTCIVLASIARKPEKTNENEPTDIPAPTQPSRLVGSYFHVYRVYASVSQ